MIKTEWIDNIKTNISASQAIHTDNSDLMLIVDTPKLHGESVYLPLELIGGLIKSGKVVTWYHEMFWKGEGISIA